MEKYRIIKLETKDGAGETNVNYRIQKKFLFFWINATIRYGYTLEKFHGGSSDLMISKAIFNFSTLDEANLFLGKYFISPFKEIYKGNKIIRVALEAKWTDMYVNLSDVTDYYAGKRTYDYSFDLERLKSRIDKRQKTTSKSVMV